MKFTKFFIAVAAICVAGSSWAQSNAKVGESNTNAGAVASFDSHNIYEAQNPPVASAFAPALSAGFDTCMGSTSGAVSSAVIGVALGSTYVDAHCQMLKSSRELWNMGQRAAALARMCMDALNRESMELTGYVCPQTTVVKAKAKAVATVAAIDDGGESTITDPIIRARNGWTPL